MHAARDAGGQLQARQQPRRQQLPFTGRLSGKRLARGTYTLVATPTANGKDRRAATANFKDRSLTADR